jgi:hypothetical protein
MISSSPYPRGNSLRSAAKAKTDKEIDDIDQGESDEIMAKISKFVSLLMVHMNARAAIEDTTKGEEE